MFYDFSSLNVLQDMILSFVKQATHNLRAAKITTNQLVCLLLLSYLS